MNSHKALSAWINKKRLRDYPRIMLITVWLILAVNILLRNGWQGAFGQIIGGDFIMFYSTGLLYNQNPDNIYNFEEQAQSQQELTTPTILPGLNPYMNPPYVAPLYRLLTVVPLIWSFIAWIGLMIVCAVLSVNMLIRIVSDDIKVKGLDRTQLLILVLSFFPFIESLLAGQNSGLTLLLMTCLIYFTLKEKHLLVGIFSGMMIYKPQYILGILILWVVWKNIKSLAGFALISLLWVGIFFLTHGIGLFQTYQDLSQVFLILPYLEGFPAYLLVTLYGFLTTIFPQQGQPFIYGFSQVVLVGGSLALAYFAYRNRKAPMIARTPVITLAILLPLMATPYALLHDLVILIPAFILWSRYNPSRELLTASIVIYLGTFILTLLSALSQLALNAVLVISLFTLVTLWLIRGSSNPTTPVLEDVQTAATL